MMYSVKKDVSTNSEDIEALFLENINVKSKNILVNMSYRQEFTQNNFYVNLKAKSFTW